MKIFIFIKKALIYILKFLKLNRIIYKVSKSNIINIDSKSVRESYEFLENYSPDPRTSCICKNKIAPCVDIHIIVEFESRIPDVAFKIQEKVKSALEEKTGYTVASVNIHVDAIHFPEEEN